MSVQDQLLKFLNPTGNPVEGIPIPELTQNLAQKITERIDGINWYLNRYSLELNFKHGRLTNEEYLALARDWGFKGAQLHVAKGESRTCLSKETDNYLTGLAKQENLRKLDLQMDVSSSENRDIEETVRVARVMGIRVIRCYIRSGGTLAEIILEATNQLRFAADLAEKWDLECLLEQHELLTGSEMVEIVSGVGSPRLGILFDFANPITARRKPLEDLFVMQKHVRGAHAKDVCILEKEGMFAQSGVKMGEGDLNLPKLFFDLMMLGADEPQVKFFAVQMVVDYYAVGLRSENANPAQSFEKRNPSKTNLDPNLSPEGLQNRLNQERKDAGSGFQYCKNLVAELKNIVSSV